MIFKDINEINKKYGLNHNNYQRYLKFCNNKILNLNEKLNIKNIKSKSYNRKHLNADDIILTLNEEDEKSEKFNSLYNQESKRIHYFLMLSIVILERDFQKANFNLKQDDQTLEAKLVENEEITQIKHNKYWTDQKYQKCCKHFQYYFDKLQQLCSKRIVFDFIL